MGDIYLFFFNDTATTEIYPLSLHDALPILTGHSYERSAEIAGLLGPFKGYHDARAAHVRKPARPDNVESIDRKSTRLNSSHGYISYAVFCLKKKKNTYTHTAITYLPDIV